MKVLMCYPEKGFEEKEIDGSLESMQEAVGGYIETLRLPYDNLVLVFDEEGKLKGKPFCLKVMNFMSYWDIVGDCFFCRSEGDELVGLDKTDIARIVSRFMG